MNKKELIVKCPNCQKQFNYYQSTFRPFCCERCRMIDLGCWLDESYRVPLKGAVEEIENEFQIDEEAENVEQE